jgi:ubiquinone/menaquinone biosynthesis C-methylase UbiE
MKQFKAHPNDEKHSGSVTEHKAGFLDTAPNSLYSQDYKERIKTHWTEAPCGTNYTQQGILSKEYFKDIEAHRYRTHPWIKKTIDRFDINNKNVLEIGFGVGSDHLNLARRGARMHGIDLTPKHLEITRARLGLYGFSSKLLIGDGEDLPFPDNCFDFVYSFGVIHHSPNTQKIISEIYRVLTPGGRCYITVYHKNSIFFWWSIFLVRYILRKGWQKRSLQQELGLVEYPNTDQNMVVKLYKKKEFKRLFHQFNRTRTNVKHLLPVDILYFSLLYHDPFKPTTFTDWIGRRFGWYIVLEATK